MKTGMAVEGIFRRSTNAQLVKAVKEAYNSSAILQFIVLGPVALLFALVFVPQGVCSCLNVYFVVVLRGMQTGRWTWLSMTMFTSLPCSSNRFCVNCPSRCSHSPSMILLWSCKVRHA